MPQEGEAAASPLSHHAIMVLVAPFTRRGYHLDMAASDRARNDLVFHPVDVAAQPGDYPALRCTHRLERRHREKVRITRTLETLDGQSATVIAEGRDPADVLDAVEHVAIARQLDTVGDVLLFRDYRISLIDESRTPRSVAGRDAAAPRLIGAKARIGAIELVAAEGGWRDFEFKLTVDATRQLNLTEDLLAVLGWSWRPLRRDRWGVWLGSVRAPVREPRRTAVLERQLDRAVRHLSATLRQTPVGFHPRYRGARWRAGFQRLLPILSGSIAVVGFLTLLFVVPKTPLSYMLMLHGSILVIVAMSLMNRAYRVEIPPLPRPLSQPEWCSYVGGPGSDVLDRHAAT